MLVDVRKGVVQGIIWDASVQVIGDNRQIVSDCIQHVQVCTVAVLPDLISKV